MFTQRKTETALFHQMGISYMPRAYTILTSLTSLEARGSQLRFQRRFCSSYNDLLLSMSCFFSHKIASFLILIHKSSYIFHLCQIMFVTFLDEDHLHETVVNIIKGANSLQLYGALFKIHVSKCFTVAAK